MARYGGTLASGDTVIELSTIGCLHIGWLIANCPAGFMLTKPSDDGDTIDGAITVWVGPDAELRAVEPDPSRPPRLTSSERDALWTELADALDLGDVIHATVWPSGIDIDAWDGD